MTISTTQNFNFKPDKLESDINSFNIYWDTIFHAKADMPISYQNVIHSKEKYRSIERSVAGKILKDATHEDLESITPLMTKSTFHNVFKVTTKKSVYALKINVLSEYYKDFTFLKDMYIQKKLRENGLPALKIVKADISRKIYPLDYMIMDYISSQKLESEINHSKIYYSLGEFFNRLHAIVSNKAGQVDVQAIIDKNKIAGSENSWKRFFSKNLTQHIDTVYDMKIINSKEKDLMHTLFAKGMIHMKPTAYSLLHNDPGGRNIFFNRNGIEAIIDWEDAIFGDPLWEVAFVHTFLFRPSDTKNFLYFCKGYGIAISDITHLPIYWIYYLRISLIKASSRSQSYYNKAGFEIDRKRVRKAFTTLAKLL